MLGFLPKIYLDFLSFWAGVLAAVILLILVFRYRSRLRKFFSRTITSLQTARDKFSITSESDYSRILYKYMQGRHIASDLVPLEKIVVPPKCIAPPPVIIPGTDRFDPSLLQQILGHDPAFPEFAVDYFAPTFTLMEALSNGANLCLMGSPGSGKTVAIAYCITSLIKNTNIPSSLLNKIPYYVDAQYIMEQFPGSDVLSILLTAIQANPVFSTIPNFPKYFTSSLNNDMALLFIDGLDTQPSTEINRVANFIIALCKTVPTLQVVVAASPTYLGNLIKAPLEPVSVAPWGKKEKLVFLEKWVQLGFGSSFPTPLDKSLDAQGSQKIRDAWLIINANHQSPLEFTLKAWAAYSGDITGPTAVHAIESYLGRITLGLPQYSIKALENIALHVLEQEKGSFTKRDINSWLSSQIDTQERQLSDDRTSQISRVIQFALDSSLLQKTGSNGFFFTHPTIAGFLAARGLCRSSESIKKRILRQPDWALIHETMRYFSAFNPIRPHLNQMLSDSSLLKTNLMRACQWLVFLDPSQSTEEETLLRSVTREIQTNQLYFIKLRLTNSLATSQNPKVAIIFRHLLQSQDLDTRRAAALGSGFIQDPVAVPLLTEQLNAPFPTSAAACYALGKIASPKALEAIAESLLHGDELLRRAAAESLAHNRSEGHPALREGITMDDLLVRYAVVHGLSLIPESWAVEILDKMRIDEDEWIVRDLAQQVFEILQTGSPYVPVPETPAHKAAWLHSYAEKQDMPIHTSESALDLLLNTLENGSIEQKQAALHYLRREDQAKVLPVIVNALEDSDPDVKQQAALTLWYCAPPGYKASSYP
ncbi:MAG: HEAT repeat domain-containing protein [Anaerolineales bacterium]|nr:HEAT repeat domain-containing protein [Anaerolineales bacterium]